MKPILFIISLFFLTSACSEKFKNNVDQNFVQCGLPEHDTQNKLVNKPSFFIQKDLIKIFGDNGEAILDFDVTEKNCLVIPKSTKASSIVYNNRVASRILNEQGEFKSCGQDCSVFPTCGFFKSENNHESGPWVYIKPMSGISRAPDSISALIESDAGLQSVPVSDRGCFKINVSQSGMFRLSDESGNFIEKNIRDILSENIEKEKIISLSLRSPFTEDEQHCKKDSDHFKLVGDKCLPRDIRDYCVDMLIDAGRPNISRAFGTSNCDRIWTGFSSAIDLSVSQSQITSAKYFSGLKNLKSLDLSKNEKLRSLKDLVGIEQLESLNISDTAINISDCHNFPNLKTLEISVLNSDLESITPFKNIKGLVVGSETDLKVLKKFPNLERLGVKGFASTKIDVSLISELTNLKELIVQSETVSGKFPTYQT